MAHKSVGYIPSAFFYINCPHLRLCLLNPNEAILDHRQINEPTQLSSEKIGLVITPLSQTPLVKRYANQDLARQGI